MMVEKPARMRLSRRHPRPRVLLPMHLFLHLFLLPVLLYSCASGLRRYQFQQYHYYSPDVPPAFDRYRITLISDIHVWDPHYLKNAEARARQARFDYLRLLEITRLVQSERSDLLLLAGDYVSYRHRVRPGFSLNSYFAPLRQVQPKDGTVAVLGNHDYFLLPRNGRNPAVQAMNTAGARLLVNEQLQVPAREDPSQILHIVGIDDYMFGTRERQGKLFAGLEPDNFVLALTHNPDSFDLLERPELVDLALAGHLHGGQITLFGLALDLPARRKYLRQPFQTPNFPVFVSNGLGASRLQMRVMAPPQIWTIVLHRQQESPDPSGTSNPFDTFDTKSYRHAESKRLAATQVRAHGRAVRPRYPAQDYRLIKISSPAQTYQRLRPDDGPIQ
ncbi:metallophosphoesterase [Candidatus Haliotispira prima]|uniref:Metallophosphoesterase n=1 Tax=Candidatus Haliotispira prima TaxID=3034016 RepID=A0ABY8MH50_9SPIO|nr:metallophosphoesterase [Candidatus Haliotispira prima]